MRDTMHRSDRASWRVAALAALLLGGPGCDAEGEVAGDDEAGAPRAALELGELGEGRRFAPYEPAQALEIHHGPQGGSHVFVDGRLVGEAPDACLVTLRMFRTDDDTELTTIQHLREPDLLPDEDGHRTLEDLIVFLPDDRALDGVEVRIEGLLHAEQTELEGDEVLLELHDDEP